MPRRKHKRFAGTPAEHRSSAGYFLKAARRSVKQLRRALGRGSCTTAFHELIGVNRNLANAASERDWAHTKRAGKPHRIAAAALRAFTRQCEVKHR